MIDLHTHSLLSDGELLPSELARRAEAKGYEAIGITDHVDASNIDFVIPRIIKACGMINKYWKIKVIPGIEISHAPIEEIKNFVRYARKKGIKLIVGHGETLSEPVIKGTNKAYIEAGVDILAHPGMISVSDVKLAKRKKVNLEITTRKNHLKTNRHVINLAVKYGANLVLNTDTHSPNDLIDNKYKYYFLKKLNLNMLQIKKIENNSVKLIKC